MNNPSAAIIIIGDEVLAGRIQDANVQFLATRLGELGIDLGEVRIIPDELSIIVETARYLSRTYDQVFTTGGLGATHDDITASSIAEAFGCGLAEDSEALKLLASHYKEKFNDVRRRMAIVPKGSRLITNPVSVAPGFQVENVFCLPGIPLVMQAMFEGIIDRLKTGRTYYSKTVTSKVFENNIANEIAEVQTRFPEVTIGSYPRFSLTGPIALNLFVRGQDPVKLEEAVVALVKIIEGEGEEAVIS